MQRARRSWRTSPATDSSTSSNSACIVAAGGDGLLAAYERCRSPLDMGRHAAPAHPHGRVSFVPTAALVARRAALGDGFDERLQIGEDVDLAWRLHEAGWQIRFEPRVAVSHANRASPLAWYLRRLTYNSSVVPLYVRHPSTLPILFLGPGPGLAWSAALAGRPAALLLLTGVRAARLRRMFAGRLARPAALGVRISAGATAREGGELARALVGPWSPLTVVALAGAGRRGLGRRLAALVGAWLLAGWLRDRPELDPLTYAALRLADEGTRGIGILCGCLRARQLRPLLPARPSAQRRVAPVASPRSSRPRPSASTE